MHLYFSAAWNDQTKCSYVMQLHPLIHISADWQCVSTCLVHRQLQVHTQERQRHVLCWKNSCFTHFLHVETSHAWQCCIHANKSRLFLIFNTLCMCGYMHTYSFQLVHTHSSMHVTDKYTAQIQLIDCTLCASLSQAYRCLKPNKDHFVLHAKHLNYIWMILS